MLTNKQTQMVKLKAKGLTSKQIAQEMGIKSAQDVTNRLNKPSIKAALYKELARQGLTLDKVIAPIAKGINAKIKHKAYETETIKEGKRTIQRQKEIIISEEDNIPLQLQASDRAIKLMGLDRVHDTDTPNSGMSKEDLERLASESDEITLTQLIFKREQG